MSREETLEEMNLKIRETNFKQETLESIEECGKTISDIEWIGSNTLEISNFWEISDFIYDSGYGVQEIPADIVVMFWDGSYLEREEVDGSEWWWYHERAKKKAKICKEIEDIKSGMI